MAHKDIRIRFKIEDRRYEAVGFLQKKEKSVLGDVMLERVVGKNGGAIGEDDERFISERRHLLPEKLQQYYLATRCSSSVNSRWILCFIWNNDNQVWFKSWDSLDYPWLDLALVVRRCA